MKLLLSCLFFALIFSCDQRRTKSNDPLLRAHLNKTQFDTLHDWDLGDALLAPISLAKNENEETEILKKFSPGQQALYHFWHLNDEVVNGGFIQYYWNGYGKNVLALKAGLKLIDDTTILDLVTKADQAYVTNKSKFNDQKLKGNWEPLYDSLKEFDTLDNLYYQSQQSAMLLFEKFIRKNPDQFVQIN